MNEWEHHTDWWLAEVRDDPIYRLDVLPLFHRLLGEPRGLLLDLGCGEGQVMKTVGGEAVGCDVSMDLLQLVDAPVVRAELPELNWLRNGVVDTAFMVLVLEHLSGLEVLAQAARVVRPGGQLIIVMNHPAFTASGAGPILDPTDGEVLWRWGDYFAAAAAPMATAHANVTFYHRPLADVLNAAAAAGWSLDTIIETGLSKTAIATEPGYVGQEQIPRLLGARWMNTQGSRVGRR